MMHPPISTLMAPPDLFVAVDTKPRWIQRLSCSIDNFASVPVLQKSRVQSCKRVAWTYAFPAAEWASCST